MRRIIAALSLLSLTNLVFVQSGSACPLAPTEHSDTAVLTGHEGHDMGDMAMNHEKAQSLPDEGASHSSACPTMSACVATLDVVLERIADVRNAHTSIDSISDDRPASLASTPESPPPRA